MKRPFLHLLQVAFCFLFVACDDGDSDTPDPENSAPGSFTVTVGTITQSMASISWNAPTDPDGDVLTYDVLLSNTTVSSGQSGVTFELTQLDAGTAYTGSVKASDGNGGESSASFSFTTEGTSSGTGNQNPGAFTVTVSNQTHNSAALSWTAATDPDGDNVTYSVELDGTELATAQAGTTYDLTDLTSGAALSGVVTALDGNGGETETAFDLTVYVVDISQYSSMTGFVSATLVDCSYSEGGSGKCYQIVFSSNPVNDDGPYCPTTTFDVGGFGNYDGTTNPGFQVMKASLFQAMETDGYDIISNVANMDGSFNIEIETDVPGGGRVGGRIAMGAATAACLQPTPDDALTLTFEIPVNPEVLSAADNIESVEFIGLALDGVPINGAPPSVVDNNGKIPSLDRCGGHHDPSGYYHWHFLAAHMDATLDANGLLDKANDIQCSNKTQSSTALVAYARDGYPIYSGNDMGDTVPTGLDACNGHEAATADYPDGIYHYHASTDITNVPPCIVGKQSVNSFDKPS
ncbi:MAG: YHYH protein [Cyclobacteriaceae bacterium]